MKRMLAPVAVLATLAFAAGCSLSDTGYQGGALGNGGFYFSCTDAVSCQKYSSTSTTSNDAALFPKAVALSSTFSVRFVRNGDSSPIEIHINDGAPNAPNTIGSLGGYVTNGPQGLLAMKEGFATLAAVDSGGQLIDYTTLRIVKPEGIVVYVAGQTGTATPKAVTAISLTTSGASSSEDYRAFARLGTEPLAGSLQVEWKTSDATVVEIQQAADGRATLTGRRPGSATITATGALIAQDVPVVVTQ